ncbi:MAG: DNA-3-methyladenine glycosylase 2 family protein [Chloroflexi bacterium]|nr:DNA-3-methyladenine glycosylase 2 family protein [Chloroflexota bacterium]MBU1752001.1 DNA-3-methyladenine glycosylase 2 family protein [Chloroflexota bacterium]
MSSAAPLTDETLAHGLRVLATRDPDLARILRDLGPPPMWAREPGFPTLVHIILEQQVSLASARAAYDRLLAVASPLTPARFLELDAVTLRAAGFSRQKAAYGAHLARAIIAGQLDLTAFDAMDDAAVRAALVRVKGIGPWTADIYLLMALRRPDVWPGGDLALAAAVQEVKQLARRPTPDELHAIGAAWQPWRAVAARLLWHHYLSVRAPSKR